jgi:hypothetical protein
MSRLFRTGRQLGFLVGAQKKDKDESLPKENDEFEFSIEDRYGPLAVGWISVISAIDKRDVGYLSALTSEFRMERPPTGMPVEMPMRYSMLYMFMYRVRRCKNEFLRLANSSKYPEWVKFHLSTFLCRLIQDVYTRSSDLYEQQVDDELKKLITAKLYHKGTERLREYNAQYKQTESMDIATRRAILDELDKKTYGAMEEIYKDLFKKGEHSLRITVPTKWDELFTFPSPEKIDLFISEDTRQCYEKLGYELCVMMFAYEFMPSISRVKLKIEFIGKTVPYLSRAHTNPYPGSIRSHEFGQGVIVFPPVVYDDKFGNPDSIPFVSGENEWEDAIEISKALVIPVPGSAVSFVKIPAIPYSDTPESIVKFLDDMYNKAITPNRNRKVIMIHPSQLRLYMKDKADMRSVHLASEKGPQTIYPLVGRTILFPVYRPLDSFMCLAVLRQGVRINTEDRKPRPHDVNTTFYYVCGENLYTDNEMETIESRLLTVMTDTLNTNAYCARYADNKEHATASCDDCRKERTYVNLVISSITNNLDSRSREFLRDRGTYRDLMWKKVFSFVSFSS